MPDNIKRKIIVDAATRYFSKYGYYKTTMDEIARHIHKAKGLLYYYFKNKESLFKEVLRTELNKVKTELKTITDSDTNGFDMLERHLLIRFKLLYKAYNYHETLRADFFEKYDFVKDVREDFFLFERSQINFIIKKCQEGDHADISDTERSTDLIMILLTSIEIPLFLQEKYEEYEHAIDELILFIIKGIKKAKSVN